MTSSQQHQPVVPSVQQAIIEETVEEWQAATEDPEEGESNTFADALKGWFDTAMQELHDSRGDAEYQEQIIGTLRDFATMIQQVKAYDFGVEDMEEWISIETLPEDLYMKALRDKMPLLP